MSPGDIEVTLAGNNVLTISGEKRSERDKEGKGVRLSERAYGSSCRSIPLPWEIEPDKVEATFRNRVLSIVLPKSAKAMGEDKEGRDKDSGVGKPRRIDEVKDIRAGRGLPAARSASVYLCRTGRKT